MKFAFIYGTSGPQPVGDANFETLLMTDLFNTVVELGSDQCRYVRLANGTRTKYDALKARFKEDLLPASRRPWYRSELPAVRNLLLSCPRVPVPFGDEDLAAGGSPPDDEPQATCPLWFVPPSPHSVPQALNIVGKPSGINPPTREAVVDHLHATSCSTNHQQNLTDASVAILFQQKKCRDKSCRRQCTQGKMLQAPLLAAALIISVGGQPSAPRPPPSPQQQPPPPPLQAHPLPLPPIGTPPHPGGWFGGAPAMGMLPGWTAHRDAAGLYTFRRDGRDGCIEIYPYHPLVFAVLECLPPSSPWHVSTYSIIDGTWYPCRDILMWLSDQLCKDPQLAKWAYIESGRVYEQQRVLNGTGHIPNFIYPDRDQRPRHLGAQRQLPAPIPPRERERQAELQARGFVSESSSGASSSNTPLVQPPAARHSPSMKQHQ